MRLAPPGGTYCASSKKNIYLSTWLGVGQGAATVVRHGAQNRRRPTPRPLDSRVPETEATEVGFGGVGTTTWYGTRRSPMLPPPLSSCALFTTATTAAADALGISEVHTSRATRGAGDTPSSLCHANRYPPTRRWRYCSGWRYTFDWRLVGDKRAGQTRPRETRATVEH